MFWKTEKKTQTNLLMCPKLFKALQEFQPRRTHSGGTLWFFQAPSMYALRDTEDLRHTTTVVVFFFLTVFQGLCDCLLNGLMAFLKQSEGERGLNKAR